MKKLLVLLSIISTLFSCTEEKKEVEKQTIINHKAELNQYFKTNYDKIVIPSVIDIKVDSINRIHKFYNTNDYKIIWINDSIQLTDDGIQLIDQLSNSLIYGLDSRRYKTNSLLRLKKKLDNKISMEANYSVAVNLEVLLTHYYMKLGTDLNYGVLGIIDSLTIIPRKKFNIDLSEYFINAYKSDSIIQKLLALQPDHPQYKSLQKGMEKFIKNSSMTTRNINVENYRIDSIKAIKQAKKALVLHNYLSDTNDDQLYFQALTKFQIEHGLKPDSLIGKNTARALSVSPYRYYKQIVTNLERWKWKQNWPSRYLYVNIPGYKMEMFSNAKLVRNHKIVVGKIENQTPEIIDTIEYIIAYPYWNVPRSISVKEILVKAQKDTSYLVRNNYEIMNYSRENLDLNSIDWSSVNENNFNYLIRQKGGASNALGLVKFIFPNKYAIYLHDTPTKYYFDFETRAYSHGCVRVQNALDLAEYILTEDNNKYNIDSIYNYIDNRKEKPIPLNNKIPIFIYYFTTSVDSNGNIIFYEDVYQKDEKVISELSNSWN